MLLVKNLNKRELIGVKEEFFHILIIIFLNIIIFIFIIIMKFIIYINIYNYLNRDQSHFY